MAICPTFPRAMMTSSCCRPRGEKKAGKGDCPGPCSLASLRCASLLYVWRPPQAAQAADDVTEQDDHYCRLFARCGVDGRCGCLHAVRSTFQSPARRAICRAPAASSSPTISQCGAADGLTLGMPGRSGFRCARGAAEGINLTARFFYMVLCSPTHVGPLAHRHHRLPIRRTRPSVAHCALENAPRACA